MECRRFKMIVKMTKFVLPIILGALGGYLYYDFIGCNNGCAITGNPFTSTAYGAVVGAVFVSWKDVFNSFKKSKKEEI
jgi:hypothetical protein